MDAAATLQNPVLLNHVKLQSIYKQTIDQTEWN